MAATLKAMNEANLRFNISGIDDELLVAFFKGEERLSQPFRYSLTIACTNAELDFDSIVGQAAVLGLLGEQLNEERRICGFITEFEQAAVGHRRTLYRAVLEPRIKVLDYRQDCRIFQEKTVPDIVAEVLDTAITSAHYQFRLTGSYGAREYCVQYRESDLNFVSRLLEEEGMFYYFEHGDDGETLVIGDSESLHEDISKGDVQIRYHDNSTQIADREFIHDVTYRKSVASGAVTLRDYNFKKPTLDHMHLVEQSEENQRLEVYDYPGIYEEPGVGQQRVQRRLEQLNATAELLRGESTSRRLVPGYIFELTDHPRASLNGRYIIVSVNQEGREDAALEEDTGGGGDIKPTRFTAIPDNVVYRPPNSSERSVIRGIQTAIVVGAPGEEIDPDEFGRVKVQFHWDRQGQHDDKSSCWIRVSQVSAGAGFGGLDIPRVGQEVIVSFLEGNPDRPVITGRVYHGTNRPPNNLPADKVKTSMKSNSSPGGGGSNELTFDDSKGKEGVLFNSQYGLTQSTGHNKTETVGNDVSTSVGNNETISVATNRALTVGADQSQAIGANDTVQVGADQSITVSGSRSDDIGSSLSVSVGASKKENVASSSTELVGIAKALNIGAAYQIGVGAAMNVTVGGASMEQIGLVKHIIAGNKFIVQCGAGKLEIDSGGKITISGTSIDYSASGPVKIAGTNFDFSASGPVKINGSVIDLN